MDAASGLRIGQLARFGDYNGSTNNVPLRSVGPNWPNSGEIDVLEGVHEQETNVYSLHTSAGCTLSTDNSQVRSKVLNTQCASSPSQNAGCNFADKDKTTYGRGFNTMGGGVFAHLWDDSGIRVWHFARNAIPADVDAKRPNPSAWGTPAAFWSTSSCNMAKHFQNHVLVLDTTLCGDLGNPTFASSGCKGTCAQAVADPKNFRCECYLGLFPWQSGSLIVAKYHLVAKWMINYIAVYQ
jgi:hypothetical protein